LAGAANGTLASGAVNRPIRRAQPYTTAMRRIFLRGATPSCSTVAMRSLAAVGLAFLIALSAPGTAHPGDRVRSRSEAVDDSLRGNPIECDFTLEVHLSDCRAGNSIATAFDESCERRELSVPHVRTGQRIPLPRTADGSCFRHVTTEIDGMPPLRIEYEPAGCLENTPQTCTHWIQHKTGAETSEHVDYDRCEVVIDEAIARDEVHRKVLRRAPTWLIEKIFGH
jgi:hypothetical protein